MYPRNLLYLIVLSSCKKALQAGQRFFGDTFKISTPKHLAIFLGLNIKIVQSTEIYADIFRLKGRRFLGLLSPSLTCLTCSVFDAHLYCTGNVMYCTAMIVDDKLRRMTCKIHSRLLTPAPFSDWK